MFSQLVKVWILKPINCFVITVVAAKLKKKILTFINFHTVKEENVNRKLFGFSLLKKKTKNSLFLTQVRKICADGR